MLHRKDRTASGSSLPVEGECLYALCVETKTALILGGGGITGGMYELGALSAIDDFIVSGGILLQRESGAIRGADSLRGGRTNDFGALHKPLAIL
jgi:predicted acylesterase/phospholipase RssA